jgi:predicted metal-dependent peptidase
MLMIGKQLTVEQRLQKAVVKVMDKATALSSVLMIGERTVGDVPTACTNGRDEIYGRAFVEGLNDAELRFLILHEVYHKLYKHLTTWRSLHEADPRLANMACDYVINLKITDEFGNERTDDGSPFVTMPEGGLVDDKYRGMNAKQVYDLLKQEDGQNGGKGGEGDGETMDHHDWEGAKEMTQEEKGQLDRDIDEAIRQGALVAGKLGTGGLRDMDDLLQAKVDWREALRDFVQTTCVGKDFSTWRRPNRRYISHDIYMPSSITERVEELVIAIDTSGSVDQVVLSNFLGEVKGICDQVRPERVRLLYWDTAVCADEVYEFDELENIMRSTKPAGGGGTSVECVPAYMLEHDIKPQAVVVLTDGYLGGSWGAWNCPVLWCILNNKQAKPTYGAAVHIED